MTYTGHHDAIIATLRSDLAAANTRIATLTTALAKCDDLMKSPLLVLATTRKEHGDVMHPNFVKDFDFAIECVREARRAAKEAAGG